MLFTLYLLCFLLTIQCAGDASDARKKTIIDGSDIGFNRVCRVK